MTRNYQIAFGGRINPSLPTPAYLQVTGAIIRDIENGRLAHGTFLPSSRKLAVQLKLNRKTIVLAYEELISQGWLEAAGTRGTMVAADAPLPRAGGGGRTSTRNVLRNEKPKPRYRVLPTPEHEIDLPGHGMARVDDGEPDGRLFPAALMAQAYRNALNRAVSERSHRAMGWSGTDGLRSAICDMLRHQRGLLCAPDDILTTRGRQSGLFMTAQALLRPGDIVLVEELTYQPAVAAFGMIGARVIPVRSEGGAIDLDEVERICRRHQVRAIYVTPHCQFPTTTQMGPEQRLGLLNLAAQFGYAIIEDDYGSDFNFVSQPMLPMAAYAPEHVVYLGSLSTVLSPALRIGYIHAPQAMTRALGYYCAHVDVMGNRFTEDAAAELIGNGAFWRHVNKVHKTYAERRMHTADVLRARLADRVAFDLPDSGLALWLQFPEVSPQTLNAETARSGLGLPSVHVSSLARNGPWGVRFGFGNLDGDEAGRAADLLARALARALASALDRGGDPLQM
ncbi:PLP-dependent aminotransferase family protein [Novosphingobium guangzhouense]|uniref:HTH gntR-type domain-containing protein n=1 Tax=Novosphingobium guangzhouense TaxID=1850347 RepID=A0A2K2G392_9SPHN|nr:PLP-dependent aminotransferase family protein [Novosphingobium guangzhouense]PNU05497.1 hypothetical protein A8V01_16065 [Novosphingobium guangzhouense]